MRGLLRRRIRDQGGDVVFPALLFASPPVPQFPCSGSAARQQDQPVGPWGHPGAVSAPMGSRRGGRAKQSLPRCWHPHAQGCLSSRQMCGCKETQLCREGRSVVGAARHVSIPQPTLPRDLPLSLGHRRGGVRGFTPNPMLAPALPCPPLASSQLEVSVLHLYRPRGTQPARAKLGGSNGRTGAHHPPWHPLCVPHAWQGRWPLSQQLWQCLCHMFGHCDLPWSVAGWRAATGAGFGQGACAG